MSKEPALLRRAEDCLGIEEAVDVCHFRTMAGRLGRGNLQQEVQSVGEQRTGQQTGVIRARRSMIVLTEETKRARANAVEREVARDERGSSFVCPRGSAEARAIHSSSQDLRRAELPV